MTANNPNIDLVSIKSYIKFDEIRSICSQGIERKQNFGLNQIWYKCAIKKMCDNPNLDLVNMNAYIKFGEILSICFQDIEQKLIFGINQGPLHWYKCAKNDV